MEVFYRLLFSVSFKHTYFNNAALKAFRVGLNQDTAIAMEKLGLLFKLGENGFSVLCNREYDINRTGCKKVHQNDILQFPLYNTDPLFLNYTNGLNTFQFGRSVLHLNNFDLKTGDHKLHKEDFVSGQNIRVDVPYYANSLNRPFGLIEIGLDKITGNEDYQVCFEAKNTFWRYILVSEHFKELPSPAILNREGKSVFSEPALVVLPDQKKALMFVSHEQLGLRERQEHYFRLVENFNSESGKYKVAVQSMPVPDMRYISVIDSNPGRTEHKSYSDIIL